MKKQIDVILKKDYTAWAMNVLLPEAMRIAPESALQPKPLAQTKQTIMLGIDYALSLGKDPVPVILAAALFPRGQETSITDDIPCEVLQITTIYKFLERNFQKRKNALRNNLSDQSINTIIHAILYNRFNKTIEPEDNYIAACLWDADRTIKAWSGDKQQQFSTNRGRQVASFNKSEQKIYLEKQQVFLNKCQKYYLSKVQENGVKEVNTQQRSLFDLMNNKNMRSR